MSRYGRISLSLMNCQIMRVISSPSSSTTGVFTVILAMRDSFRSAAEASGAASSEATARSGEQGRTQARAGPTVGAMTAPTIVILAAGRGTRMRSATPKVLHPLCGRPLVHWPVHAARDAGAGRIVVVDSAARPLDGHLPHDVVLAVQERPNGTADAVESAVAAFPEDGAVIVLSGDVPLVTSAFVSELMAAHAASGAAATMATML